MTNVAFPQTQPVAATPPTMRVIAEGGAESVSSAPLATSSAAAPAIAQAAQQSLLPARVVIELDKDADRFVQTFVDGTGETVLGRYPSEAQLAFSRGVAAYFAAMARR